jgi:hypothetical protein
MLSYYSYKMVRDFGFAPNPFNGICTLATCKPAIRKYAEIGDWVIGSGSVSTNLVGQVIYLMKISEKLTFDEYWNDQRFQSKKPVMNVGLKRMHGDNIYNRLANGEWQQQYSQHSKYNGVEEPAHKKTDLGGEYVLLANYFFYFGDKHFLVPQEFKPICSNVRDRMKIKDQELAERFIKYVEANFNPGVIGDPIDWIHYNQFTLF